MADGGDPITLTEVEHDALRTALLDEWAAEAYYGQVLERFQEAPRGLRNIRRAEMRHSRALLRLYERAGLEPPSRSDAVVPEVPPTLEEALGLAIEHEKANAELFDELIAQVENDTVKWVFERLGEASRERHLPALERQLEWVND